jgi:hypothetical protein
MASRLLIAGATGVFGGLLARRLLEATDAELRIGSRDGSHAALVCERLATSRATPIALDLRSRSSFEHAAKECTGVVCAAGPFQHLPRELPRWAVAIGAHWLDIADDPGWILGILDDGEIEAGASAAGVVVAPGLSTTPAISGALVELGREALPDARTARICLFIGNRNAKGAGVLASAVANRLRPSGRASLPLAGRRELFACPSADDALLRRRVGIAATFFVAPEFATGARMMRFVPDRPVAARMLSALASVVSSFGTERGVVEVEVRSRARSVCTSASGGQEIAVEPCVLGVRDVLAGLVPTGLHAPADVVPAARLRESLTSNGFEVTLPRPGRW